MKENSSKDNCNIRIFMGTNDEKTRNEISEACGKHKVKSVSYSESKDMNVSTSAQSVPLIYPSELKNLNNPSNGVFGNAIVLVSETFPIRGRTTPYFKAADIYGLDKNSEVPKKDFMIFDENDNRYDVLNLVYLQKILNEEVVDEVAQEEELKQTVTAETIRKTAFKQLQAKINKMISDLQAKISEEDFLRLAIADTKGKIEILDEIAEQATHQGDLFLAMQIENVLGLLKQSGNGVVPDEQINEERLIQ